MSWYAHPWWGVSAFAFAALAGALAVQWALRGRRSADPQRRAHAAHAAIVVFWVLALAFLSFVRLGSAYIALWWVIGLSLALMAAASERGRRWRLWLLLGALPAGTLTLQLLIMLALLFVPVFGRLPLAIAPDLVLAVMLAVPAAALALVLLPGARAAGGMGRTTIIAAAAALVLMAVSLLQHRYTESRAQRLAVVHHQDDDDASLRVFGMDYLTPRLALAADSALHPAPGSGERPLEFAAPAGPTRFPAPTMEVVSERRDGVAGTRRVTLRVSSPGAYRLRVLLPLQRLAGWSLPVALPRAASGDDTFPLDWVAPPDSGVVFSLDVRGDDRLAIHIAANRFVTTTAGAALMRTLPPWTDSNAIAVTGEWWHER
jgi:hypothetical protein